MRILGGGSWVVAIATVSALGLSGTAHAAVTAYNAKEQYLVRYPDETMETSCVERRIQLAARSYDWGQFLHGDPPVYLRRDLRLGAGWYTWKDCLDPGSDHYYTQTTWLDPDNPAWTTISIQDGWRPRWSGDHRWGSLLDPREDP